MGSALGTTVPALQAFSAFFYTMNFLRTVMGLPVATLQQLEAAVVTVCNQTWSEVRPPPRSPRAAQEGLASRHQAPPDQDLEDRGNSKAHGVKWGGERL